MILTMTSRLWSRMIFVFIWTCGCGVTAQGLRFFPGIQVAGGVLQASSVNTALKCYFSCVGAGSTQICAGFDFDFSMQRCYLLSAATVCGAPVLQSSFVHYTLISCTSPAQPATATPSPTIQPGLQTPAPSQPGLQTPVQTIPPVNSGTVTFVDFRINNGTRLSTVTTINQCRAVCVASGECLGYDWSYVQSFCFVHTRATECTNLIPQVGVTHFRLKGNCGVVNPLCYNLRFEDFSARSLSGGTQIAVTTSLMQCKALCQPRQTCQAVTWNRQTRACVELQTPAVPLPSTCCDYSRKVCLDTSTPVGLFTTAPYTTVALFRTTQPGPSTTTAPLETGKCPQQVIAYAHSKAPGGQLVPNIITAQTCRDFCLGNATCDAVDFDQTNTTGPRCLYHSNNTYTEGSFLNNNCCVHYVKLTQCQSKMCWVTPSKSVSQDMITVGSNSTDPDTTLVACKGLCLLQAVYSVDANKGLLNETNVIEITRSCDNSYATAVSSNKNCQSMILTYDNKTQLQNVSVSCLCTTDKCNSFWVQTLQAYIAHYTLDCNVKDSSFAQRNGVAHGLIYDGEDQAKNWSAVFNGTNYFEVSSFRNVRLGSISPAPLYIQRPEFTILFWFKFTSTAAVSMALINNGPPGEASLSIYTEPVNTTFRSISGGVSIDGEFYNASIEAPYQAWNYFSMRVMAANATGNSSHVYQLVLNVGNASSDSSKVTENTMVDSSTSGFTVDISPDPLSIGKNYIPTDRIVSATDDFYTGKMDEIYIFGRALPDDELRNAVESSYNPSRYNP